MPFSSISEHTYTICLLYFYVRIAWSHSDRLVFIRYGVLEEYLVFCFRTDQLLAALFIIYVGPTRLSLTFLNTVIELSCYDTKLDLY